MNFIVLLKQIPDIARIPPDAWDHEKGTLKRGLLDAVVNPLDLHALTLAYQLREKNPTPGAKIIALTMGPPAAVDVICDALSRGADDGVLLTDPHFAGADTMATAFSLAMAIKKIEQDFFSGNRDYVVVSGVQSTDGDTAQVPPQVAEELGLNLIAYAVDVERATPYRFKRIGPVGIEIITPGQYPVVVTCTDCTEPMCPSFQRARASRAKARPYHVWHADDIPVDKKRIGFEGSMTQVTQIFSPQAERHKECLFIDDPDVLISKIAGKLKSVGPADAAPTQAAYSLKNNPPARLGEVWVFAEIHGGAVIPVTRELLGKARGLADCLGQKVGAVLVGANLDKTIPSLIAHGVDKVYVVDHPCLETFRSIPYAHVLTRLVKEHKPQIMLFGATPMGRELAPRVSYATGSGLTADCTKLEIGDYKDQQGILLQTRPALGGNIMATIVTRLPGIQMATVRPGVFGYPVADPGRTGEVIRCSCEIPTSQDQIEAGEPLTSAPTLAAAKIIVSGGAGLRNTENFDRHIKSLAVMLEKFCQLKTSVGASRRAVERGIISRDHQVGQTGQTVQPDLYVAVGISGAVQHISGMQKSSIVVAINPDRAAPIFKLADVGVVGKAETVIPQLLACLKKRVR